ncbi:MAG TPA: DUF4412 domain-containing protein, partial [Candidatus Binataceae bacterium]
MQSKLIVAMFAISTAAFAIWIEAVSAPAFAGVVIAQDQTSNSGTMSNKSQQTIMIQGNKEKLVNDRHTTIIDMDGGKMFIINPNAKEYYEIAFPPPGIGAGPAGGAAAMNLKKAGSRHTVIGYECEDYNSSGKVMTGEFS